MQVCCSSLPSVALSHLVIQHFDVVVGNLLDLLSIFTVCSKYRNRKKIEVLYNVLFLSLVIFIS